MAGPLDMFRKDVRTYWSTEASQLCDHQAHDGEDEPGATKAPHNPSQGGGGGPGVIQFFLPQSLQS